MISGMAEAAKHIYRKVACTNGRKGWWLYPVNSETPGENVYYDPLDPSSQGFAGSTLSFTLEDGTIHKAKGPWHSNTDALFSDTGVDLRDTHRTWGVVAKRRVALPRRPGTAYGDEYRFEEVLHGDGDGGVIGAFSRLHDLARKYAQELGVPVAYYAGSRGGSSCGWEMPEGSERGQWDEYIREHSEVKK